MGERRDNSAPTHPWALGRGADWGYHAPVAEPLVAAPRRTTVILGEIPCRQCSLLHERDHYLVRGPGVRRWSAPLSVLSRQLLSGDGATPFGRASRDVRSEGAFFYNRIGIASGLLVLLETASSSGTGQHPNVSDDYYCLHHLVEFSGRAFYQQHSGAVVVSFYRAFPVFSTAFAVFYLLAATFNYALITYHPLLHELDLLPQPPKAGPAMYWYGWIMTAGIGALAVAAIALLVSDRWESWIQRAIIFSCAYAVLYVMVNGLALFIYDRASYELEFLKHPATAATGALVLAVAASFFFPIRWTRRLWSGWCGVIPLSVMLVFVYLLRGWFIPSVALI